MIKLIDFINRQDKILCAIMNSRGVNFLKIAKFWQKLFLFLHFLQVLNFEVETINKIETIPLSKTYFQNLISMSSPVVK